MKTVRFNRYFAVKDEPVELQNNEEIYSVKWHHNVSYVERGYFEVITINRAPVKRSL